MKQFHYVSLRLVVSLSVSLFVLCNVAIVVSPAGRARPLHTCTCKGIKMTVSERSLALQLLFVYSENNFYSTRNNIIIGHFGLVAGGYTNRRPWRAPDCCPGMFNSAAVLTITLPYSGPLTGKTVNISLLDLSAIVRPISELSALHLLSYLK